MYPLLWLDLAGSVSRGCDSHISITALLPVIIPATRWPASENNLGHASPSLPQISRKKFTPSPVTSHHQPHCSKPHLMPPLSHQAPPTLRKSRFPSKTPARNPRMLAPSQRPQSIILTGDCRTILRSCPAASVNCCVTSPPYWGLRDYGCEGQLGLQQTPDEYVGDLVGVLREARRVLRDDATLWLNLGDSYQNAKGQAHGVDPKQPARRYGLRPQDVSVAGLKPKDLVGIPWRVAFALQADGWYLRQDLIWHKPNPMPESVTDRWTKAHEYIFLLSKSAKYYYDADAIAEPIIKGAAGSEFRAGKTAEHQLGRASAKPRASGNKTHKAVTEYEGSDSEEHRIKAGLLKIAETACESRNKRSVWTVAPKPFKEAHFATFPPALIEPCILAGCPPSGIVLDPFGGAGTTGLVASRHGRRSLLIELNPTYAEMARRRIDAG